MDATCRLIKLLRNFFIVNNLFSIFSASIGSLFIGENSGENNLIGYLIKSISVSRHETHVDIYNLENFDEYFIL